MDDDLLGGPPSKPPPPANDLDDDLLGGGTAAPPANAAAFDDDLLFGDAPAAPPPAAAHAAPGAAALGGGGGGGEDNGFTTLTAPQPLRCDPVKEAPQALVSLVDANTFFLRQVVLIADDGTRVKTIVRVTKDTLQLLYDTTLQSWREQPVKEIMGFITQTVNVSKMFGSETEIQGQVQVLDGRDIHLAFPKDSVSDALESFTTVLTSVCDSIGLNLPVSGLSAKETLTDYMPRVHVDPRLRRQVLETLHFRTELFNDLNALTKEDNKLEVSIAGIKGSSSGHEVLDLVKEIQQLELLIASYTHKADETRDMIAKARGQLEETRDSLRREQQRRDDAVGNAVEDKQKEQLQKQVALYNIAKANHKRDMDRIAAVTSVYERRAKDRTKEVYAGGDLPLRLEDLEEMLEDLTARVSARGDAHTKRVKALAENKRRHAHAEDFLEQLKDDIKVIEGAGDRDDLPSRLLSLEIPDLSPVVPTGVMEAEAKPAAAAHPPAAKKVELDELDSPRAPPAKPAAKAPVDLDDEDI